MAELVKHQAYPLHQLGPGDRFYFVNDKKKKVFTLDELIPFEIVRLKGFWVRIANCRPDPTQINPFPNIECHKANRTIIFLRNQNDTPCKATYLL